MNRMFTSWRLPFWNQHQPVTGIRSVNTLPDIEIVKGEPVEKFDRCQHCQSTVVFFIHFPRKYRFILRWLLENLLQSVHELI